MTLPNVEDIVRGLINKALENGASDNVSVIIIKGEPESIPGMAQS